MGGRKVGPELIAAMKGSIRAIVAKQRIRIPGNLQMTETDRLPDIIGEKAIQPMLPSGFSVPAPFPAPGDRHWSLHWAAQAGYRDRPDADTAQGNGSGWSQPGYPPNTE